MIKTAQIFDLGFTLQNTFIFKVNSFKCAADYVFCIVNVCSVTENMDMRQNKLAKIKIKINCYL